jgi:hypothetical protein
VLYEVLAGWPPLLARTEEETLERVRFTVPEPLTRYRDALPAGLADLVAEALEKNPRRRGGAARLEVALSRLLGTVAPHFTEADLSATLVRLFQGELRDEVAQADGDLAARIRAQLHEVGLATSGAESAEEMLAMGTVALATAAQPSAPPAIDAPRLSPVPAPVQDLGQPSGAGGLILAALGLSVLIVVGIVTFVIYGPPGPRRDARAPADGSGQVDAGPATGDGGVAQVADADEVRPPGDGGKVRAEAGGQPSRRWGTVTFNSEPWSYVYVDGTKLPRHTPILRAKLRAGRHQVRFVNPELGLSKTVTVRLAPNEESFVKVQLRPDRVPEAP